MSDISQSGILGMGTSLTTTAVGKIIEVLKLKDITFYKKLSQNINLNKLISTIVSLHKKGIRPVRV